MAVLGGRSLGGARAQSPAVAIGAAETRVSGAVLRGRSLGAGALARPLAAAGGAAEAGLAAAVLRRRPLGAGALGWQLAWKGDLLELALLPGLRLLLVALARLASRVLSCEGDLRGIFVERLVLEVGLDVCGRWLPLLFLVPALARLASRALSWEGDLWRVPFLLRALTMLASRVLSWEGDLGGGGLWKLVLLRGCRPTSLALPRLASRALSCDGDRRGGWAREPVLVLRGGRLLPPPPLLAAELPKLAPPSRAYSSGSGIFLPSFLSIFFARSPSSFSPRSSTRPSAISLLSSLGRDSPELPSPSWSNPMESQNFASLLLRLRSWDMYVTFSRSLSSIWRCICSAHALY